MQTTKVSDYRSRLAKFHKSVIKNSNPLRISGNDGDVVVLSAEDYENILENLYVLKDKVTLKSIQDTRKSIKSKKFKGHAIKKVFNDLVDYKNQ